MHVAVLAAFVREPREILLLADRTAHTFLTTSQHTFTFTALIAGSEEDFENAAGLARSRPKVGAVYYPDEATLWREALDAAPPGADVIVTLDGATDWPEEIPELLKAIGPPSVGLVVGVRRFPPEPPLGIDAVLIQTATGGAVSDLTSAFRAYRASAVRHVHVRGEGREALCELAAAAVDRGYRIAEVPVTTSAKADPLPPDLGRSLFLRGLTGKLAPAAVLMVLLGVGVFFGFSWPPHQYIADSDAVISAICATEVLEGRHFLFFPTGYRMGSQSCYLGSLFITLFGRTREAMSLVTLTWVALYLTLVYLALKIALGRGPALAGMIAAVFPPLHYILFVEPPWGYGESVLACALVLYVGFVLVFRPALRSGALAFGWGLAAGFAFWTSPQTLMLTAPLTLMLVLRKVFPDFRSRAPWLAGAGFFLGVWPYYVTLATKGTRPFTSSFATKPVDTIGQLFSNVHYLFSAVLPTFFIGTEWPAQTLVQGGLFLLLIAGFTATVVLAVQWFRRRRDPAYDQRTGLLALLTLGVFVTACTLFPVSSAGSFRIWTPRYVAPVFFMLPLMVASLYAVARRNGYHPVVVICALAFAGLNLSTYRFPGSVEREIQTAALQNSFRMHRWLELRGRNVVLGDYWLVYKLNFGFGNGIDGIPVPTMLDWTGKHHRYTRPVRLALMHIDRAKVEQWGRTANLSGHVEAVDGEGFAFVVDGEIEPSRIEAIAAGYVG